MDNNVNKDQASEKGGSAIIFFLLLSCFFCFFTELPLFPPPAAPSSGGGEHTPFLIAKPLPPQVGEAQDVDDSMVKSFEAVRVGVSRAGQSQGTRQGVPASGTTEIKAC